MVQADAAVALAAAASVLAGCQHHADLARPAGLAYACADGRSARIVYDRGDPNRMPARLSFDGRDFILAPVPALNGLRYASEAGLAPGRGLTWRAEGDEAVLSEAATGPGAAVDEREIARCTRVREGETEPPEGHGEDP